MKMYRLVIDRAASSYVHGYYRWRWVAILVAWLYVTFVNQWAAATVQERRFPRPVKDD